MTTLEHSTLINAPVEAIEAITDDLHSVSEARSFCDNLASIPTQG
jgi:hypothetical protein